MTKKRKKKKVDRYANLLSQYEHPAVEGSLGGVVRFAKARKLPVAKVREKLEADLGYTLHKPTRRRAIGGGSHRSGEHCQIKSRVPLFVDRGGRVVQVRVGGTCQDQDRLRRDSGVPKNLETE